MTLIRPLAAVLAVLSIAATPCRAQVPSPAYQGPVAVVVAITIPPGLTRPAIDAQFRKLAPAYARLPGLKMKYFTVNDTKAGGIYLWVNRAAADAFYTSKWRAGVQKVYGAAPELTFFDAPVVIEGSAGKN